MSTVQHTVLLVSFSEHRPRLVQSVAATLKHRLARRFFFSAIQKHHCDRLIYPQRNFLLLMKRLASAVPGMVSLSQYRM